ncbi:hypothetical protein [Streptomyces pseudovenezuelae]|uniref:Lantibiotic n=1 Tax=Streptomyces pseudovenezuelae TaxID=67350 RepID=A0ABZ1X2G7_9ACTN|nr:hypothetical protein [Streptomyces pseudovenezuelae]
MTKMLSGVVGRMAEMLLPKTSAAAGCAKECWTEYNGSGAVSHCCTLEDCHTIACSAS